MYVLLSGAKANLGDFLITERAIALLRALRPDRALRVLPSWKPLDPKSEELRSARAILIAGGPGYQPLLYPRVYPLTRRLDDLPCPVVPLGLGWKGQAGDEYALARYVFSEQSLDALRWMAARTPRLGCRDPLSVEVLRRHGIDRTELVGCPVWYDLASIGRPPQLERQVARLVFTPAQGHALRSQSLEVARRIAELFPRAERIASFHRGLAQAGRWLPDADLRNNRRLAESLTALGFRVEDVTGDTAKIAFYDDCSLHVGYRVHAHLHFLSRRRPSLLVEEDGRGAGASLALGIQGVPALRPNDLGRRLPRGLGRWARPYRVDPEVPDRVAQTLEHDLTSGFVRFAELGRRLDAHFLRMSDFLRALP